VLYSQEWDLVVAHPPCTRLCNSGVSWLDKRNLWDDLIKAMDFFKSFQRWQKEKPCRMLAIENPIPHKYARDGYLYNWWDGVDKIGIFYDGIGNYSQIIQPWMFGHGETKATCLWLYNLPILKPTDIVDGREQRLHKLPPSKDRAKLRSKTYIGIAKAMASQWSKVL